MRARILAITLLWFSPAYAGGLLLVAGASQAVPPFYLTTRDQAGHELVKTEEFVVPVGTTVVVKGLEFDSPGCSLTAGQERILWQVFNSLEEITENTVNDTDRARVAQFAKMQFEVRGYSTLEIDQDRDRTVSKHCAETIVAYLTKLGTPAWRLSAKGLGRKKSAARQTDPLSPTRRLTVEFARTK